MLVFVDESGDSGMKCKPGSSEFFVITAVTFNDNEDADSCDKKISELRQKCFRGKNVEFKFNKCCDDYREAFLQGVAGFDFFYLAFGLDKAKLYGPGFNYKSGLKSKKTRRPIPLAGARAPYGDSSVERAIPLL